MIDLSSRDTFDYFDDGRRHVEQEDSKRCRDNTVIKGATSMRREDPSIQLEDGDFGEEQRNSVLNRAQVEPLRRQVSVLCSLRS